jgi:hypothetical protein
MSLEDYNVLDRSLIFYGITKVCAGNNTYPHRMTVHKAESLRRSTASPYLMRYPVIMSTVGHQFDIPIGGFQGLPEHPGDRYVNGLPPHPNSFSLLSSVVVLLDLLVHSHDLRY